MLLTLLFVLFGAVVEEEDDENVTWRCCLGVAVAVVFVPRIGLVCRDPACDEVDGVILR